MFKLPSATAALAAWLVLALCLLFGIAVLNRCFVKQLRSFVEFVLVIGLIGILTVIAGIIEH